MSERLSPIERLARRPWDRMEDGRELIVMAFPAGEADAASKLLRQAAREIETGQRILSL